MELSATISITSPSTMSLNTPDIKLTEKTVLTKENNVDDLSESIQENDVLDNLLTLIRSKTIDELSNDNLKYELKNFLRDNKRNIIDIVQGDQYDDDFDINKKIDEYPHHYIDDNYHDRIDFMRKIIKPGRYFDFSNRNCIDIDDPLHMCRGWNGISYRCDCGNCKVRWFSEYYKDKTTFYAEAWS